MTGFKIMVVIGALLLMLLGNVFLPLWAMLLLVVGWLVTMYFVA